MLIVFFSLSLSSERENNAKIIFNFSMDSWKDRFILFFFKYAVYMYIHIRHTRESDFAILAWNDSSFFFLLFLNGKG